MTKNVERSEPGEEYNEDQGVRPSGSEIEIGERVEILEGAHKHKTGLVYSVLDNLVQVIVDDRDKKARFFKTGSVRSCRTTAASTQMETSCHNSSSKEESNWEQQRVMTDPETPHKASKGSKQELYKQSSLLDQLEDRSILKSRVDNLLEDLEYDVDESKDEAKPPVRYISFETTPLKESIIPAHLGHSLSNGSTLTNPSIRQDQKGTVEPNGTRVGQPTRSDPHGRTLLDPPLVDVTVKPIRSPSTSKKPVNNIVCRQVNRKPATLMQGSNVQVCGGVHKGRSARVSKVKDDFVQVLIAGSNTYAVLSPSLLRALPDPPSSLDQLWRWSK